MTSYGTNIPANEWHFVGFRINKSLNQNTSFIYDGILKDVSVAGKLTDSNTNVYIGARTGGNVPFNGTIDDVKIFDYALTAQEIEAIYNRTYSLYPNEVAEGDLWRANVTYVTATGNTFTNLSTNTPSINYLPSIDSMTIVEDTYYTTQDIIAYGLATDQNNDTIAITVNWHNGSVSVLNHTYWQISSFEQGFEGWSNIGPGTFSRSAGWSSEGSYSMVNTADITGDELSLTLDYSQIDYLIFDYNRASGESYCAVSIGKDTTTLQSITTNEIVYNNILNLTAYTGSDTLKIVAGGCGGDSPTFYIDNIRFVKVGTTAQNPMIRNNTNLSAVLPMNYTYHFDNITATATIYDVFETNTSTLAGNNQSISNSVPTLTRIVPARFYDTDTDNANISGTLLATCDDADFDPLTARLYVNDTLNGTINTSIVLGESFNLTSAIDADGIYGWLIECADTWDGTNSTNYTLTIDLDAPNIIYNDSTAISPLNTTALNAQLNATIGINITLTDNHGLFAFNYSIYDTSGNHKFSLEETNLGGASQLLTQNITPNISIAAYPSGEYIQVVHVEDDHTAKEIPAAKSILKDPLRNRLDYALPSGNEIDINLKSSTRPISDYTTVKEPDRYQFTYTFTEPAGYLTSAAKAPIGKLQTKDGTQRKIEGAGPKSDWPVQSYTYTLTTKAPLYYRPASDYPAHFVSFGNGSREWIDFQLDTDESVNYSIAMLDTYSADITITTTETDLIFQSLGGLNMVEENSSFNVSANEVPTLGTIEYSPTYPHTNETLWFNVSYNDFESNPANITWLVLINDISIINVTNDSIAANSTVYFNLSHTYYNKTDSINITVNATDNYGGMAVNTTINFSINNSVPLIPSLLGPGNNSQSITGAIDFGFSTTDTDSDAITYYLYVDDAFIGSTANMYYHYQTYAEGWHNFSVVAGDGTDNSSRSPYLYFQYIGTRGTSIGLGGGAASSSPDQVTVIEQQPTVTSTGGAVNISIQIIKSDAKWLTTQVVDLIITTSIDAAPAYLDRVWVELTPQNGTTIAQDLIRDDTLTGYYSFGRTAKAIPVGRYSASIKTEYGTTNYAHLIGTIDVVSPANALQEKGYQTYNQIQSVWSGPNGPLILLAGTALILLILLVTVLVLANREPDFMEG